MRSVVESNEWTHAIITFRDGTSDLTRTFHYGIPSDHEKVDWSYLKMYFVFSTQKGKAITFSFKIVQIVGHFCSGWWIWKWNGTIWDYTCRSNQGLSIKFS